jgi:hypothetical protein
MEYPSEQDEHDNIALPDAFTGGVRLPLSKVRVLGLKALSADSIIFG